MIHNNRLMFSIIIAAVLLLSACSPASTKTEKVQPFKLEPIEGTELSKVILTEKAAKRLDIQTAMVGDEYIGRIQVSRGEVIASPHLMTTISAPVSGTVQAPMGSIIPVTGDQVSAGQVVYRLSPISAMIAETTDQPVVNIEIPADTILLKTFVSPGQFVEAGQPLLEVADINKVWIRVRMTETEFNKVNHGLNANILLLESDDADEELEAEIIEEEDTDELEDENEANDMDYVLYYGLDNSDHKLSLGQHVQARLALLGNGKSQNVIPYAAVIYDTEGNTWVYTNPEPLVFVRQPIVIDYIEGDWAVLAEGMASGTLVVTIGASELLGAELGVAK